MEYPQIPQPPLITLPDKESNVETLKLQKQFYEKYLNDLMKHQNLRKSLSLEVFLTQ